MRKGMLGALLLGVLTLSALATFAACCPGDEVTQGPGDEWQVMSGKGSYLGVEVSDVTKDRIADLKLRDETGVEVTAVDGDAPAAKAGIKEHDVILAINGQKIESEEQLRRVIRETPAGRTINLTISRNGQQMNLSATVASRKDTMWVGQMPKIKVNPKIAPMPPMPPGSFHFEMPDMPEVTVVSRNSKIGAMVENITPQLADFFGVKDGTGLLVRSVEKGSVAETAGMKAGDVIVRIEKERVNDLSDWRRMLRNKSGNVSIGVIRDKREQNVTLNLPERKETGALYDDEDFDVNVVAQLKGELAGMNFDEQSRKSMAEVEKQMQAHRGEYDKAMKEAQKEIEKSMKEHRKEMEKLQKELQKSFKTISIESED